MISSLVNPLCYVCGDQHVCHSLPNSEGFLCNECYKLLPLCGVCGDIAKYGDSVKVKPTWLKEHIVVLKDAKVDLGGYITICKCCLSDDIIKSKKEVQHGKQAEQR